MRAPFLKIENAGPEKARLRLALILHQKRREWYASYAYDVARWDQAYADEAGEYPKCIHGSLVGYGVSLCSGCDDGYGEWNYLRSLEDSLGEAKMYFNMMNERREWAHEGFKLGVDLRHEVYQWLVEPVSQHLKGQSWTV